MGKSMVIEYNITRVNLNLTPMGFGLGMVKRIVTPLMEKSYGEWRDRTAGQMGPMELLV